MKVCKKCEVSKSLSEYYVHPQMSDGYINICKECTKKRVREFSRSERGREYDRERNKTDKRRRWLRDYLQKRRVANPIVTRCRNKFEKALLAGKITKKPCEVCGEVNVQGHHEDYNRPLQVTWLCGIHHRELHGQYKRRDQF